MAVEAVAEFKNVVKEYPLDPWGRRKLRAVDDVTFTVNRGEVVGLLGPNRAGKTTLIKILLSLCQPTSGTILRLGASITDRRTLAQVGYVHENHAFPKYLTAEGLLNYYGTLTNLPVETLNQRVPVLLEKTGLIDRRGDYIGRFSKGMLQRLGVAQALLNEPELLVFDEPSEGLDLFGRQLVASLIQEQRKLNRSVILVTHNLPEVADLCDRVIVIFNSKRLYMGSVKQLITDQSKGGPTKTVEQALQSLYEKAAT